MTILLAVMLWAQAITGGNGTTTITNALTFNDGPAVLIKCDTVKDGVAPTNCYLVKGHTLDEVMAVLWQQNEDRRAMYQAEAEMLKRRVKLIPPISWRAPEPVASNQGKGSSSNRIDVKGSGGTRPVASIEEPK